MSSKISITKKDLEDTYDIIDDPTEEQKPEPEPEPEFLTEEELAYDDALHKDLPQEEEEQ